MLEEPFCILYFGLSIVKGVTCWRTDTISSKQKQHMIQRERARCCTYCLLQWIPFILSRLRINPLFLLLAMSALVRTSFLSICATFWFRDILYLTKQSGIQTNRLSSFTSWLNILLKDNRGTPQECVVRAHECFVMKMFNVSLKGRVTITNPNQQLVSNFVTFRSNCVRSGKVLCESSDL